MWRVLIVLILWAIWCGGASASDVLREQHYAHDIKQGLGVGKALELKAGEQEFPRNAESWAYTALIPEAAPRISAAIDFLKQRKIERIVIIGHSLGARMGLEMVAAGRPDGVIALVVVGVPTNADEPDAGTLGALKKLNLPILDIYGSRDLPSVLSNAKARNIAARQAGNSGYRQVEIIGADHYFRGMDDTLLARVNAWIGREAAQSKLVFFNSGETEKPSVTQPAAK